MSTTTEEDKKDQNKNPIYASVTGLCVDSRVCVYSVDGKLVCRDVKKREDISSNSRDEKKVKKQKEPVGLLEAMSVRDEQPSHQWMDEPQPAWSSKMADSSMKLRNTRKRDNNQ